MLVVKNIRMKNKSRGNKAFDERCFAASTEIKRHIPEPGLDYQTSSHSRIKIAGPRGLDAKSLRAACIKVEGKGFRPRMASERLGDLQSRKTIRSKSMLT